MVNLVRLNLEDRVHRGLPSGWQDLAKFIEYPLLAISTIVAADNCGVNHGSPTSPTDPTQPPDTSISLSQQLQTFPDNQNAVFNADATLTSATDGTSADIEIKNGLLNIKPENKIKAGGPYTIKITPKPDSVAYKDRARTTSVMIVQNKQGQYELQVMLDDGKRPVGFDTISPNYNLFNYQLGGTRNGFMRRWSMADQNDCPNTDLYTTLYKIAADGLSLVVVDQKADNISQDVWDKLIKSRDNGAQDFLSVINGQNRSFDGNFYNGVQFLTGLQCSPKVRRNVLDYPLDVGDNRITIVPVMDLPDLITEADTNWTTQGKIRHAQILYRVNRNGESVGKGSAAIDYGRAYGPNPPKPQILGFSYINEDGTFKPELLEITKLMKQRKFGQISNSTTPDFQQ